jgi:hypothetical protein
MSKVIKRCPNAIKSCNDGVEIIEMERRVILSVCCYFYYRKAQFENNDQLFPFPPFFLSEPLPPRRSLDLIRPLFSRQKAFNMPPPQSGGEKMSGHVGKFE